MKWIILNHPKANITKAEHQNEVLANKPTKHTARLSYFDQVNGIIPDLQVLTVV